MADKAKDAALAILIGKGKPMKKDSEEESEDKGSDESQKAIAKDLLKAVKDDDVEGIMDVFDALYEKWSSEKDED